MAKLLLLSMLVSIIAGPAIAARDPLPRRGLKKTLVYWAGFNLFYVLAVEHIYPRLFW
jgi:hypothetical protein